MLTAITYYLSRGTSMAGKSRYYFAREPKGKPVAHIRMGSRITEGIKGVVSLSRAVPPQFLPAESAAGGSA